MCTFPFILLKFLSSFQYTFDLLSTLLVHLTIHYDKNQIGPLIKFITSGPYTIRKSRVKWVKFEKENNTLTLRSLARL